MSNDYTISPLGLKLIKAFEGFRGEPTSLVTGQRVVGYGHPLSHDEVRGPISRDVAAELLREDLEPVETLIKDSVFAPLTQSQFDALCSLVFNIGPVNFMGSNLRYALNNGRSLDAAAAFDEWRKAEIAGKTYVVDALVRRRTAEKALFLRSEKGMIRANAVGANIISDDSYLRLSDDDALYDEDSGIVNEGQAELNRAAKIQPMRRREDESPAGVLTLTERDENEISNIGIKANQTTVSSDIAAFEKVNYGDLAPGHDQPDYRAEEPPSKTLSEVDEYRLDIPHPNDSEARGSQAPSPIALAAAEVSDRLDALIDSARLDAKGEPLLIDDTLDYEAAQSALVAANSNEGDEPVSDRNWNESASQSEAYKAEIYDYDSDGREPLQDLSAADILENHADPRGADAFIKRIADETANRGGSSGRGSKQAGWIYGIFIFIGACLLSAGLVIWLTAMDTVGEIGRFFAPWAMVFGALLILGGLYYALRRWMRP